MTDNDIIKALEICTTPDDSCNECPYDGYYKEHHILCDWKLREDALSLINRQKAELDDLKRDDLPRCKDALRRANEMGMDLEKENKELRAEIEKLELLNAVLLESCNGYSKACDTYKAEIERLKAKVNHDYILLCSDVAENRAEAIKEFAERLKEKQYLDEVDGVYVVDVKEIDNLVKEMVGEDK